MADTPSRTTGDPMTGEGLRERYRIERDKRLRHDGAEQYIDPVGQFAHFLDDPWARRVEREPLHDDVTVALIGGGFAGLVTGARLVDVGVTDVRIIDSAGGVGGVWYWNRYPGAMCDTAAMIYLPLLEETGTRPSAKYVQGAEILTHAQRIAEHWGLCDNALFSTEVTELRWDADSSRWIISTDRGDRIRARFVAMGTGPLNRPKLPGIPGIGSFGGHSFHTSRWDWDYTGGDPAGARMENLADKRVGIIGTGATGVQAIPYLARDARELLVFQRTPSSIDVRNNHPIDPEDFAALEPGWQQKWLLNFATLQTGGFTDEDLVKDGWTDIAQRIRDRVIVMMGELQGTGEEFGPDVILRAYEESDDEKMSEIRARVDAVVEDPAVAAALKPWYRQLCKRPCFHDEYLQAYNNPDVTLVDTDGAGVERIDETGLWVAWIALRGRLPRVCVRIRGQHLTACALCDHRARWRDPGTALVRGNEEPARHLHPRLPEPVHPGTQPGCQPDLQRHAQLRRGLSAHRGGGCPRSWRRMRRGGGNRRRRKRHGSSSSTCRGPASSVTPIALPGTTTTRAAHQDVANG